MLGKTFRGGVHPEECKHYAPHTVYEPTGEMVFPLSQHIGKPADPLVSVGDRVLVGQKIAERSGYISSSIHSSCSGTVTAIERRATIMGSSDCIVVDNDCLFEPCEGLGQETDTNNLLPDDIKRMFPAVCTHRIHAAEGLLTDRQAAARLVSEILDSVPVPKS